MGANEGQPMTCGYVNLSAYWRGFKSPLGHFSDLRLYPSLYPGILPRVQTEIE